MSFCALLASNQKSVPSYFAAAFRDLHLRNYSAIYLALKSRLSALGRKVMQGSCPCMFLPYSANHPQTCCHGGFVSTKAA
eukprot:2104736-Amphidinium_carterae.1